MPVVINGTTGISGVDGSAGTPSYQGGDTNTGVFFPAADVIAFTTNGTEDMRINSSGNVGIGTSSPTYRLDVNSGSTQSVGRFSAAVASTTQNNGGALLRIQNTDSTNGNMQSLAFTNSNDTSVAVIFAYNANHSTNEGFLTFGTRDSGGTFGERMRIDSSGNVGIGVTSIASPSSGRRALQVSNSTSGGIIYLSNDGTESNNPRIFGSVSTQYDLGFAAGSTTGFISWYTNGTERMRITSVGELLVGTTSANGRVTADSTAGGTNQAFWGKNSGGAGAATIVAWNATTTGNPVFVDFYTEAGATQRGTITYNRGTGQVAYNVTSDERLKENIVDAPSALNKINSIKIRSFDWKETGNHNDFGVIAQELNQVAPEAVTEGTDNNDGTIKHAWGVDTAALVPAMIKAIQEQQAMIEELKQEVAALEAK